MAAHSTFSTRAIGNSRGFINTDYVCIGTPEETLLETYFMTISKFNFERAKEQCVSSGKEKERDAKAGIGGTNWCDFMNLLCRLSTAEMNYHNLTFVGKSFLKKEPLRVSYNILIQELRKVQDLYCQGRGGTDFTWEKRLADLITSICEYIMGRMELITVYQNMDMPPDYALVDTRFTDKQCKIIQQKFHDRFTHPYLKPVNQSFWSEVEILSHLTLARHHLSLWQFLPSLLSIKTTHNKLSSWCGVLPPGIPSPDATPRLSSIRSRPLSNYVTDSSFPVIYKWLCTFHNSLLSKFSLYFYNILNESGVNSFIKGTTTTRFDPDYIQRFQQLVKTTPTSCVCLVFDSTGVTDFQGPQYRVPGSPPISLTGLNSYPIIISIPMEYDFLSHKANIVSMIMSKGALSPSAGISTHHDNKLNTTYHLAQIDNHVTLVAILQTISREKDSPVVSIMTDIIYNLRCHHVLHYLTRK